MNVIEQIEERIAQTKEELEALESVRHGAPHIVKDIEERLALWAECKNLILDLTSGLSALTIPYKKAKRQGLSLDEPEGARYIQISSTLADALVDRAEEIIKSVIENER